MAGELCPICRLTAKQRVTEEAWGLYDCDRCGKYRLSFEVENLSPFREQLPALSGVTRNALETGRPLEITTTNIGSLIATVPPVHDVQTKAKGLLRHLVQRSKKPGERAQLTTSIDYPLAYASSERELHFLLNYLKELGWIDWVNAIAGPQSIGVTPAGWIEWNRAPGLLSDKAFVAMWFNSKTEKAWLEGIKPAIEACGYRPVRIDFEEHNEMIDDRIQAEIRESRFLVADLTGQRNGIYFEAGLAIGRELPVVWARAKWDELPTHFDTRQYNRIEYDTPADLQESLKLRIRATIGRGPLRRESGG